MSENKITYNGNDYSYTTLTAQELADIQGMSDLYYSEGGFKNGSYLIQFPRESDGSTVNNVVTPDYYGARKKGAHYENMFQGEIDSQVDIIFGKDQIRKPVNEVVDVFVESPTTRLGESMPDYQRRKLISSKIYGSIFEICDAPNINPVSGERDGSLDLKAWTFYLNPSQVHGYTIDNTGSLSMLIYNENIDIQNDQELGGSDKNDKILRVWLKDFDGKAVTFQYSDGVIDGSIINDLISLPIDLVESNTRYDSNRIARSKYLGELSIAKKMYNTTSQYSDSFIKNCFAFLAVNGKVSETIELGSDGVFMYMGDNVNAPDYVAPPTGHLETMMKEVERLTRQFKSNMNSSDAITAMSSGQARIQADRKRIERQKFDANNVQDGEMWLVNFALKNYITGDWEYSVLYIKDFESLTKSDELESIERILDMGPKEPVKDQLIAAALLITFSNDEDNGKKLAKLQIETVEETENESGFDVPPEEEEATE